MLTIENVNTIYGFRIVKKGITLKIINVMEGERYYTFAFESDSKFVNGTLYVTLERNADVFGNYCLQYMGNSLILNPIEPGYIVDMDGIKTRSQFINQMEKYLNGI